MSITRVKVMTKARLFSDKRVSTINSKDNFKWEGRKVGKSIQNLIYTTTVNKTAPPHKALCNGV